MVLKVTLDIDGDRKEFLLKEFTGKTLDTDVYGHDECLSRFIVDGQVRLVCRTEDVVTVEVEP